MDGTTHTRMIDMMTCSDSEVSKDIIKEMMKLRFEMDELRNILRNLLEKEYPEDVLKYAESLKVD